MKSKQYGFLHRLHKQKSRQFREFTIKIPMRLLDKKFTDKPLPPYTEIKSVLLIMDSSGIGDCIMHSIAMRELKKYIPNLRLDVIVTKRQHEFIAAYPYVDNIYMPKSASVLAYLQLGMKLASNNYDIVFYQRGEFRLRELALLRTAKGGYLLSNNATMEMSTPVQAGEHMSDQYVDILHKLQIHSNNLAYEIPSKPEHEERIEAFLHENQISDYIAVNFYGSSMLKTFTEAKMRELIENIMATYPQRQIVLLSMPNPRVIDTLNRLCVAYGAYMYEPTSSIFDSIALMRHSCMVITVDTAISHIASGLNKPTIVFYAGHGIAKHWAPKTSKSKVFAGNFEVNEIDVRNVDLLL